MNLRTAGSVEAKTSSLTASNLEAYEVLAPPRGIPQGAVIPTLLVASATARAASKLISETLIVVYILLVYIYV